MLHIPTWPRIAGILYHAVASVDGADSAAGSAAGFAADTTAVAAPAEAAEASYWEVMPASRPSRSAPPEVERTRRKTGELMRTSSTMIYIISLY
jgi:hypothetical protein